MEEDMSIAELTPTRHCRGPCDEIKPYTAFAKNPRVNKEHPVSELRCRSNKCKACELEQVKLKRLNNLSPLLDSWKRA